jgi:gliding motility-associated-like protein
VRFNQVAREELTKVKCIGDDFSFLKKKYSRPGIFFDTIRSSMGCDSVIYQLTLIDDNCGLTVYIPTAFTPNSVGPKANNVFMPFMDNHASFILKIFNRWGEKLYETSDSSEGWLGDYMGEPVHEGVYVYLLQVTSKSNKTYTYTGTFTLLR